MNIIKGKQQRAQRVVLYGVESVGKSTFAAQFPKPLFLDIEQGTSHLDVDRCDINSWKQLTDALAEAKATDYKTIVIDSADWAERLCVEDLLATSKKTSIEDFGYGKGWVMVAERISRMLTSIDALIDGGKHVVLIAHSRIVKFEAPDALAPYDRYELKLSKQCSPLLKEFADELWFLRFKTKVSTTDTGRGKGLGGKERVMLTTHSAAYDAKTRSGLAEELPLEWDAVAHLFQPVAKPTEPAVEIRRERVATLEANEEAVNAFLVGNGSITEGQTWRDASEKLRQQIVARPEALVAKAKAAQQMEVAA